MRALLITVVLCLSATATATPIERVIVFADRAEVTRATTARCSGGTALVAFTNLPRRLDVRTLRAEASKGATALGTSSRDVTLDAVPDKRLAALKTELLAVNQQIAALRTDQKMTQDRARTVSAYRRYFVGVVREDTRNAKPNTKAWSKAMKLFRTEADRKMAASHQMNLKMRDLLRRRRAIALRIGHFSRGTSRHVKAVNVSVKCGANHAPRVRLSYVVPGATWRPEYDLRFKVRGGGKTGRGDASLTVAAVIAQSTGEDWTDASIVLSTSKPRLGSRAPLPRAIYVKGRKRGEKKTLVQATERREKLRGPAGRVSGGAQSAQLDDGGQSFTLKLPRKVTIRNDGRPYWVPVDRRKLEAQSKLVATPALSAYVHQVAQFSNPAPYPLLAGKLHIHRAGTYVGATRLKYKAPGEPMEVAMGVDEEVRVQRINLKRVNRSAKFLSSTKRIEHGYRVALENLANSAVEVEVRERIPVSKIEDVNVKLLKKTSSGYQLDAHRGFLTWTVPLKRGEKGQRDLYFTIVLPKDWKVGR